MLEFNRTKSYKNLKSYKILRGSRLARSKAARFPFLCKNPAVFASENPRILFLAKRQRRQEAVRFCLRSASQIFTNYELSSKILISYKNYTSSSFSEDSSFLLERMSNAIITKPESIIMMPMIFTSFSLKSRGEIRIRKTATTMSKRFSMM